MGCTGRYATAFDFGTFWCLERLVVGYDDSGLAGQPVLLDAGAAFLSREGIAADMIIRNVTDGSMGPITNVTETTITATLAGGTNLWDSGDQYRIMPMSAAEIAQIEEYLDLAASDLHVALASVGACDCVLAPWANKLLAKLNVIEAAVIYNCPCGNPKLDDVTHGRWMTWLDRQMELIMTGQLELCSGYTGANYPAGDSIAQSLTEWTTAEIMYNTMLRSP